MECYPNLVFLHISDAVAYSIKQKNLKKVLNNSNFTNILYELILDWIFWNKIYNEIK